MILYIRKILALNVPEDVLPLLAPTPRRSSLLKPYQTTVTVHGTRQQMIVNLGTVLSLTALLNGTS